MATSYSEGTITLANGATSGTISGGALLTNGVAAGDILEANGLTMEFATIPTETTFTLIRAWPGASLSGNDYSVRFTPQSTRVLARTNALLALYSTGLSSIAGLEKTDGNIIVGNGEVWVAKNGEAARDSLGLKTSPTFTTSMNVSGLTAYMNLTDSDGVLEGGMSAGVRIWAGGAEHAQFGMFGTASGIVHMRNLQGDLYIEADSRNQHSGTSMLLRVDNTTIATLKSTGFAARNLFSVDITIADNAVATYTPGTNSGHILIHTDPNGAFPQGAYAGCAAFDIGDTVAVDSRFGGSQFDVASSNLTGTTGTDGKLTVGGVTGSLKIENRSGATRNLRAVILG